MSEAEQKLLEQVKSALGITGTFQDTTLSIYIDEVKSYMLDAGVKQTVIDSSVSLGVIVRGVADLWNYGSGDASLSNYFLQRVIQLAFREEVTT